MIFPVLELENIIQVNDKTRLDGVKSFQSPDEPVITLVEIEPESASGFIDVTEKLYLDWQYATEGTKTVTIRVTNSGGSNTYVKTIEAISVADDKLFSNDGQLVANEPDVLNFVQAGRSSFLNVHRTAQTRILAWLDENKIYDINGDRLTKENVIDKEEVTEWSKFLTLKIIFEGLSNNVGDIFHEKSLGYEKLANASRNRGAIRLDLNNDGVITKGENSDLRSVLLVRR